MIRRLILSVLREIAGLFVDDGQFALAILVWVGVFAGIIWFLPSPSVLAGAALFCGVALILAWSCLRAVNRAGRKT